MTLSNPFALSPAEAASLARRGVAVPSKTPPLTPDQIREIRRKAHTRYMQEWRRKKKQNKPKEN